MTRSATVRRANHAPIDLDLILAKSTEDGDCWQWGGGYHCGAPVIRHGKRVVSVRRYIAEHIQARSVAGRLAHTSCGNPKCCAPDHIDLITRLQLQRRTTIQTKYQQSVTRNERIAMAARTRSVLDPDKVAAIRASDLPGRDLAAQLGVSLNAVQKARNYQTWKNYRSPFTGLVR